MILIYSHQIEQMTHHFWSNGTVCFTRVNDDYEYASIIIRECRSTERSVTIIVRFYIDHVELFYIPA